ncbi:glycosyltransferase [Knoellia sinensis]|uniref:glycosyltransferase n=1 Tax=Knoellia sinensis TaxID=136100 RepID=UPI0012EB39AC
MARSLVERGHTVEVLTGFPNYPEGRLHDGWRIRHYQRDEFAPGITVHRAPLWPNHEPSAVKRMANYLSFAAGATAVALTRIPRPDVWLTYSSPATAALPAMLARRGVRAPSAMVVQDLWPDSVTGSGFLPGRASKTLDRAIAPFCHLTYRHARRIGVISPGMADVLIARGVNPEKIRHTPNSVDASRLETAQPADLHAELGAAGERIFLYAGNMGPMQDLVPLVRAFDGVHGAHLLLVGDGVERSLIEAAAAEVVNVHVRPPVPTEEVGRLIMGADVQVVSLRDTALLRVTMPSKVQTSLASGKPTLVHAAGDAAALIVDSQAGLAARPGEVESIRRAIRTIVEASSEQLAAMGQRARHAFDERFSPSAAGLQLEAMLLSALDDEER